MRQELEFFEGAELHLLYMSRRLREALKVEAALTEAAIDYFVEPGPYRGGLLFPRDLIGAFFYVRPLDLPRGREVLLSHKYKPLDEIVSYSG